MLPGGIPQRMAAAALVGLGVSSASTVGMMFIVEVEPEPRWDQRIGALQASIGGGQLAGLLIAGLLGLRHVEYAFLLGGALLLIAVPLALACAPDPVVKVDRPCIAPRPSRGGDAVPMGPQRSLHPWTWRALGRLGHSGLAWFLAAWLVSYTATNCLSVMFTVAVVHDYYVPTTLPTTAYAIGVGCSLLLYRMVGGWDIRFGAWNVLIAGLLLRALVVAGMVVLTALHSGTMVFPILICFGATQIIWPLLSVASNTLAVKLAPAHRAESVGLLNAATSLGATIGGIFGGVLLRAGFVSLCTAVLCALLGAVLLAWHPKVRLEQA
jgi:MFS family permease